jgi:hypothetical protein
VSTRIEVRRHQVPATGKVDIAQADRRVLVVPGLHDLNRHILLVPLFLWRRRLGLGLGRRDTVVGFSECPTPDHGGRGRGEKMILLWARPQGSAYYKGKRTRSSKTIDGGAELEVVVASDAAPLMAAQTRKRRRSLSLTQGR